VRRRDLIKVIAGSAIAWPLAARAKPERHIVMLISTDAEDPDTQARVTALLQGLQQLGWTDGRNIRISTRWSASNPDRIRKYVAELSGLAPDITVAPGAATLGPLLQATRTIPIVFVTVPDPVGSGFVESLARPGGNATGFTQFEYSISAKWLELLKQIAPGVTRVAVLRDAAMPDGIGQFAVIQSVAPSMRMEVSSVNIRDATEIERAVTTFARFSNGGLVVTSSAFAIHRDLIITLAARHRLPAIYYRRVFVTSGGLISYGPDFIDQFRNAAGYIDRILKGEKPADLPVQVPTKYELAINLKTAKTLGLAVPPSLLAQADEVIE